MAEETSNSSTKRLVKILVILGIGIPVLVELMTLFNLIDAQMFGGDEPEAQSDDQVSDVRGVSEGDSLFVDNSAIITIDRLRVNVSAREWRFELELKAIDSLTQEELQFRVDSLILQSDKVLLGDDNSSWEVKNEQPVAIRGQWELPNGDIPTKFYVSSLQKISQDSSARLQQEVPLDKIPVRYNQE